MKFSELKNIDRRNFVKTSSLGLASISIVPRHVLGKGYVAPSDTVYIAGVGVGGKGESDLDGFNRSEHTKIAFLCDVDHNRAAGAYEKHSDAKRYSDWRELFEKEADQFDAVAVATPDHTHAVIGSAAMTMGKHIWIQKPLTHSIHEARLLAKLADEHQVVSQMGNQGASNNGTRQLKEWFEAGVIGDIVEVHCWTNRPSWPQGLPWPSKSAPVPDHLEWDLWLGPAQYRDYPASEGVAGESMFGAFGPVAPFNWRGWWDFGTGAIGDMGAHLIEAPMNVLGLERVMSVESSVSTLYSNKDSGPVATTSTLTFEATDKTKSPLKLYWSDGGIIPPRPDEVEPDEVWPTNGILFIGTEGKMMAETYSNRARLLPESRMDEVNVPVKYDRIEGGSSGHYTQWVEACLAGYGNMEVSSPFSKAALLTEAMLIANLAIRGFTESVEAEPQPQASASGGRGGQRRGPRLSYPSRGKKLLWDFDKMEVKNVDIVNQFIRNEYRPSWELSGEL